MKNSKVFINYVSTVFFNKAASHATSFFFVVTDVKWKTCSSSYFSLLASCLLSLCMFLCNKFFLRRRTFHCKFDFLNLCTMKESSLWFVFRHKHTDVHGGSRGSRPLSFFCTVDIVPSNSLTNLKETLWKISLENRRNHQNNVPTAFSWGFSRLH